MELRAVRLGPYKGLLTPQWLTISPQLTVLFGRNGAGKTNVIEVLSDELFGVRGDTLVETRVPRVTGDGEWASTVFVLDLPNAQVPGNIDQRFLLRFLAEWRGMEQPSDDTDMALLRRLTGDLIDSLVGGAGACEVPLRMFLERITKNPLVARWFSELSELGNIAVDLNRERVEVIRLEELARKAATPPHWLSDLRTAAESGEAFEILGHDAAELPPLPLDYPPFQAPGADVDLNTAATRTVRRLWRRLERPADWTSEPSVVNLPPGVRFLSLTEPATNTGLAEVPPRWDEALVALEQAANQLLPPFAGAIRLRTAPGELGYAIPDDQLPPDPEAHRIPSVLVYGEELPAELLSSAARRWIGICLELAGAQLLAAVFPADVHLTGDYEYRPAPALLSPAPFRGLVVVDEPELHLHPVAQRQIVRWLSDRAQEGSTVVVATHAPSLLALPPGQATIVAVRSSAETGTELRRIDDDLLGQLDGDLAGLGLTRIDWLQAVAGVILVEGKHDRLVLDAFFGPELAASRLQVLPLHGSDNAWALVESEFLGTIGVPQWLLLDNTHQGLAARLPRTKEEEVLAQLLRNRPDIRSAFYTEPDIICALPEDAVRRAYPKTRFDGWNSLQRAWKGSRPENFKTFALRKMGIKSGATQFLERVLRERSDDERASPALTGAVKTILAQAAELAR